LTLAIAEDLRIFRLYVTVPSNNCGRIAREWEESREERKGSPRPVMALETIRPVGEDGHRDSPARSVILVDDDPSTAEMYRTGLEAFGYLVRVEHDGPGLFRALEVEVPDILILDWQLPGMLGDEILERVRLDPRTRALTVFMLSNYPAQKNGAIDRVFLAGAVAWLEKVKTPPSRLAAKLGEALRARPGA